MSIHFEHDPSSTTGEESGTITLLVCSVTLEGRLQRFESRSRAQDGHWSLFRMVELLGPLKPDRADVLCAFTGDALYQTLCGIVGVQEPLPLTSDGNVDGSG
jgi:hypothetical protein